MAYPDFKPCPFCGSDKVYLSSNYTRTVQIGEGYTLYSIRCSNCDMEIRKYGDRKQLVSKWQTRSNRLLVEVQKLTKAFGYEKYGYIVDFSEVNCNIPNYREIEVEYSGDNHKRSFLVPLSGTEVEGPIDWSKLKNEIRKIEDGSRRVVSSSGESLLILL